MLQSLTKHPHQMYVLFPTMQLIIIICYSNHHISECFYLFIHKAPITNDIAGTKVSPPRNTVSLYSSYCLVILAITYIVVLYSHPLLCIRKDKILLYRILPPLMPQYLTKTPLPHVSYVVFISYYAQIGIPYHIHIYAIVY
jgi:hypothetical protein